MQEISFWVLHQAGSVIVGVCTGCQFVQFDVPVLTEVAFIGPHETYTFMCAALSEKSHPEEELNFAGELINHVVEGMNGVMKTELRGRR